MRVVFALLSSPHYIDLLSPKKKADENGCAHIFRPSPVMDSDRSMVARTILERPHKNNVDCTLEGKST